MTDLYLKTAEDQLTVLADRLMSGGKAPTVEDLQAIASMLNRSQSDAAKTEARPEATPSLFPKNPLASKIDNMETEKLLAEHGNPIFSRELLDAHLKIVAEARERKAALQEANSHIFEEQKSLNDMERNARRDAYAMLATAYEVLDPETFADLQLPEGAGYTPRYEVRGDDLAIRDWCIHHAPYMLEVNRGVFDAQVKALSEMAYYVTKPSIMPPATVVSCVLPTISADLGKAKEDKPKKGKKKADDSLPENTDEIMS